MHNDDQFQQLRQQQLSQKIHFHRKEGKVWFDEQRVVLLQLASLADFRKEQIRTVGLERAKGFFMRLGYSIGLKDAALAKQLSNTAEIREQFLTGLELQSLKGSASFKVLKMEIKEETFYAEWKMLECFEADMFISEFGGLDCPVCWAMTGHASSFASSLYGREIQFREVQCRACGDPHCILIGKLAEEWEDTETYRDYLNTPPLIEEFEQLQSELSVLRHKVESSATLGNFRGQSDAYEMVCNLSNRAAVGKVSVLLLGETGVGKELVARGIHHASERANSPFVAVNCAAIPPDLIESELFGVEKGAYTGATQSREGKFERANNGTIFLDEVIELSPRAQATLLRVLQESELERVGDYKTRPIDVRVIAATNESLEEAVKEGRFRADLYYRLNVFPIQIPPLRARKDDIPLLIDVFLEKYQAFYNKTVTGFSDRAMEALLAYAWPGNVRELENLIERALILTENNQRIRLSALFPSALRPSSSSPAESGFLANENKASPKEDWIETALSTTGGLEVIEQQLVNYALDRCAGNVSEAARILGISRATLAYRMKKKAE